MSQEKKELYSLPGYPFEPCKRTSGRVDRFCTVRFDTNSYSVPAVYCGKEVSVKAGPEMVFIYLAKGSVLRNTGDVWADIRLFTNRNITFLC